MTERGKDTGFWSHPFVQRLPSLGKLLFDFLWSNSECNQAGLYYITPQTMAFFTGIDEKGIMELLKLMEPKVNWWPEINLVWVKGFLKRQCKSPDFLKAATKCLNQINDSEIIKEFLDYNKRLYEKYGVDHELFYKMGVRISEAKPDKPEDKTVPTKEDTLVPTAFESELLEILKSISGFEYTEGDDLAWLRELIKDFPDVKPVNLKACRDYHSGKPVKKGPWKNRIRQWLTHETKFSNKERDSGDNRKRLRQVPQKYTPPEDV